MNPQHPSHWAVPVPLRMRLWIRNGIYLSVLFVALPWLVYRRFTTNRYRNGIAQKLWGLRATPAAMTQGGVWFHGVSVGEVQLLSPLMETLSGQQPTLPMVLSTTTDSGMELAQKLQPERFHFYFPFDFSWAIRRTLRTLAPRAIVLGELELWPNLIDLAGQFNIPVIVINGRLSARSHRSYRRFAWLTRSIFEKLTYVATQTDTYSERFIDCGCHPERVATLGNLKFDNVQFEPESPQITQLRELVGIETSHRIILIGSAQEPEERVACDAFRALQTEFEALKLIVVPRHPDRFESVFASLHASGLRVLRRSQLAVPVTSSQWDVLLVDTVGELKWWWGLSEIAIVGGSFGSRGGQNMIEPAAYGVNVAFGPKTSNFRDVVELLLAAGAASRIESLEAVQDWLRSELSQPELGRARGKAAKAVVQQQQGALNKTTELLNRWL